MKAWTENTGHLSIHRAESGWIVRRTEKGDRGWPQDVAGIADDEGLVEWLADQLSLPAPDLPGPTPNPGAGEASAAAIVPPPVSGEVAKALAPFATYARELRDEPDNGYLAIEAGDDGVLRSLPYSSLRDLLRAAGLFTDDMRPSQPPATQDAADACVKPAGEAQPPPADFDDSGEAPF